MILNMSYGTEGVTKSIRESIIMHGLSRRVISDCGIAFTSQAFKEFCFKDCMKHILSSERHIKLNDQDEV